VLALLYVALFRNGSASSPGTAGMAMGRHRAGVANQLLQPFVIFALASYFNGETVTLQILLFASAVVATVAISTRTRRQAAPTPLKQDLEPPQLAAS